MDSIRLTQGKISDLSEDVEDDLLAAFISLEDRIAEIMAQAQREKWSAERLVTEVDALLEPEDTEEDYGT